jgi:microcystin-dependent protein
MPQHLHFVNATTNETTQQPVPVSALLSPGNNMYSGVSNLTTLLPAAVSNVGGSQAHNNMMPYLVLNFIIALQGIFPSQN